MNSSIFLAEFCVMSMHPERRRVRRIVSNNHVVVVSEGGIKRETATIRNLSPKGALVELPEGRQLAGEVYLLLFGHDLQPVDVVWQEGNAAGVGYPDDEG